MVSTSSLEGELNKLNLCFRKKDRQSYLSKLHEAEPQ